MQELVQLDLSRAQRRTRDEVEASFDRLHARGRELQTLFEQGKGTPEILAELASVRYAADEEYELLRALR